MPIQNIEPTINQALKNIANLKAKSHEFKLQEQNSKKFQTSRKIQFLENFEKILDDTQKVIASEVGSLGLAGFWAIHFKQSKIISKCVYDLEKKFSSLFQEHPFSDELVQDYVNLKTASKNIQKITQLDLFVVYPLMLDGILDQNTLRNKFKDTQEIRISFLEQSPSIRNFLDTLLQRRNISRVQATDHLTSQLDLCANLKSIYYSCEDITNYNTLFQKLRNLRHIENLSLDSYLEFSTQDNEMIHQGLLETLNNNRNFNSLFTPFNLTWSEGQFNQFIETAQQNQIKFKHLDFAFGGTVNTDLTDPQVRALSDFLRNQNSASLLESLRFRADDINQETVRYFCDTLRTLNLKELHLGEFFHGFQGAEEITLVCDENYGFNTLSSIEMLVEAALQNPNLVSFNVVDTDFISREDFLNEYPDQESTYTEFVRRLTTAFRKIDAHCDNNKNKDLDKNNKDLETKILNSYVTQTAQHHLLNLQEFLGKKDLISLQIATAAGCKSSNGEARDLFLFKGKDLRRRNSPSFQSSSKGPVHILK